MVQRLRLLAGLVLFSYVTTHLINHSLGLISLGAAEAGRLWFTAFWRHPLPTILLYGSLVVHFALVLWAIYQRRHLRIPRWEIVRLALGLLIPWLLLQHVFGTRVHHELWGVDDTYSRQVFVFWVLNPALGLQQVALLTIAWLHGSLGLHYWLRVKPWHSLTVPALNLLGPLVPILAVFGFVGMGHEVAVLAIDTEWIDGLRLGAPPGTQATVERLRSLALGAYLSSVVAAFAARHVRTLLERRKGVICLTYPDGRQVAITPGTTVLEASRAAGIPHAALCGGRGRCSTCRTRIGSGAAPLPPPSADEARVLRRIGAAPNVRLACQLRPTSDLEVFPLLPPAAALPTSALSLGYAAGVERELAILFSDLRAFTTLAERRLPYDVVFLLNQYTAAMGRSIERAGGHPNQFVGDGIMALFGLDGDPARGCRDALRAAANMADALDQLNRGLRHDLAEPLRIGIGIHTGQVIVGEMGYGSARYLTAIGDVVNTASRLESLTKEYDSQLVISAEVARRAGLDPSAYLAHQIEVRGRRQPLDILVVPDARQLEPLLDTMTAVGAESG